LGGTHFALQLAADAVADLGRIDGRILQPHPHAVGGQALGYLLALALAHLPVVEDRAGDREKPLVGQPHFRFRFVRRWWPSPLHAHLLQPANGITHDLVAATARTPQG